MKKFIILTYLGFLSVNVIKACTEFEFECTNSKCIRGLYRCDLQNDCEDGSDEEDCDDTTCTDDLYRCETGRCIPKSYLCDYEDDCEEGEDEENCGGTTLTPLLNSTSSTNSGEVKLCESWQFQCKSGSCIRGSYQCDDDRDCTDGSDEFGCEVCVTTTKLEADQPPYCKVRVYKGATKIRNETSCVADNVFQVKTGRTIPYDRRSYTEARVNYVRITCEAYYPVDFRFEGLGAIEQLRTSSNQKHGLENVFSTEVTIVATPQGTGHYIFTEIRTDKQPKSNRLFFYFEKSRKPFLVGRERIQKAIRKDRKILIPCVAAKANISLHLFQEMNGTWSKVESSEYNPLYGFFLTESSIGEARTFKCSTDPSFTSDLDIVTIIVDEDILKPIPPIPKPSNLKILLGEDGFSATCHTINPDPGPLQFSFKNINAENPLDARVLADCVLKGSLSCGSHSHIRHHQPTVDDIYCRHDNRRTKCRHISEIFAQGVLICQTETESLVQPYFTGLDDKLYKDWRTAPKSALIRLETSANISRLMSGNTLSTKCSAVKMVFSRNGINFASKTNGSDTITKHSSGVYITHSFSLKENMTQLLCSDHTWETNEEVWSEPMFVNVTPKICSPSEFKCKNGQCIRASFQCDRDRDCTDGSDELNCTKTTTTTETPATCSADEYLCYRSSFGLRSFRLCVPSTYKCDGDRDCAFGEDEDGCPTTTTTTSTTTTTKASIPEDGCGENMFKCLNGDCIRSAYKCDDEKDCKDGSDETSYANCTITESTLTSTTARPVLNVDITTVSETQYPSYTEDELNNLLNEVQRVPNSSYAVFIVIPCLLVLGIVAVIGFLLYRKYYPGGYSSTSRGTLSPSNIKYTNPSREQEEVLIS